MDFIEVHILKITKQFSNYKIDFFNMIIYVFIFNFLLVLGLLIFNQLMPEEQYHVWMNQH
jgi:hypothetical protein